VLLWVDFRETAAARAGASGSDAPTAADGDAAASGDAPQPIWFKARREEKKQQRQTSRAESSGSAPGMCACVRRVTAQFAQLAGANEREVLVAAWPNVRDVGNEFHHS
jgi:hypothetical protein